MHGIFKSFLSATGLLEIEHDSFFIQKLQVDGEDQDAKSSNKILYFSRMRVRAMITREGMIIILTNQHEIYMQIIRILSDC